MNRPIIDIVLLEDDGDDEDMESSPVINNIMSPTEEGTPTVPIGDTGNNNDTITVPIGDTGVTQKCWHPCDAYLR